MPGPRPRRQHDLLADLDASLARDDGGHRLVGAELERLHLDAGENANTLRLALAGQAHDGVLVEGEAALELVQARGDALRPPVGEERLHVFVDLCLAHDETRAVADPLLTLVGRDEIRFLARRAERHVADGVVGVRGRVGFPDLDAGLHELAHRGLEVVVADDAAGDARRSRARLRLVEHDDVRARAEPACLELLGEVVARRQAVDAGADDDVGRGSWQRHGYCLLGNGVSKLTNSSVPCPEPANQQSATSPRCSAPSPCWTRSPSATRTEAIRHSATALELGTNEIARRTGINASTVSRLLATLADAGLVEHVAGSGRYRLGLRLLQLGNAVLARLDLRELARPHLVALTEATGETATLSSPGEHEAVTVDYVQSPSFVQSVAQVGRPSAAHATAVGKVFLAYGGRLPEGELAAFTARTIIDRAALEAEVEQVRRQGFATALGEREQELNAVAAPVLDGRGELVAILGVQGPASRFDAGRMRAAAEPLLEHANAISTALGHDTTAPTTEEMP